MFKILEILLFWVAFTCFFQSSTCSCFGISDDQRYSQLEKLILKEENIKLLQDTFHPTNLHSKRIVSVTYEFVLNNFTNTGSELVSNFSSSKICFFWLSSPVHLMINKEMLEGLSLRTYMLEKSELVIQLDVSEMCLDDTLQDLHEIQKVLNSSRTADLCNGGIKILEILNDFTTNVSPTLTIY